MDPRTIKRTSLLAVAVLGSYLGLLYLGFTDGRELAAASSGKLARLRALGSPKLVLVGGSNVLFGLDSQRLQEELRLPTVNMATGAAVSLGYLLGTVSPRLGHGDLVVLSLEPNYFFEDPLELTDGTLEVLAHDPDGLGYLLDGIQRKGRARLLGVLGSNVKIIGYLDNRLRPLVPGVPKRIYMASSISPLGDMVAHLGKASPGVAPLPPRGGPARDEIDPRVIALLSRFKQEAEAAGATVVVSWPSLMAETYPDFRSELELAWRAVNRIGLISRSKPEDHVYPADCFYDTVVHLNARCRALRTEKLVAELRAR
ncbi:MAG: hypothetical protein IPO09_18615 [Anaeromyxobacter sp.]|nr:hypothetical protein [Anaeromyxobacter sp.]